jgi:hypothetical protein
VFEQVAEVVGADYEIDYLERLRVLECCSEVLKKRLRFLLQGKCEFGGLLEKGLTRNLLKATPATLSVLLSTAITVTPSLAAARAISTSSAKASGSLSAPMVRQVLSLGNSAVLVTSQAASRYFAVSCWYRTEPTKNLLLPIEKINRRKKSQNFTIFAN